MLGTYRRLAFLILPLCLVAAAPLCAQSGSQSSQQSGDPVADAARKAREQKKDQPKPKKVYDDDNIPHAPRTEAPPPAQPAANPSDANQAQGQAGAQGDAKAEGDAAGVKEKSPEEIWRERFKKQHDRIAQAEKELDVLQREDDKAQLQYYSDPQKALMEQNSRKDINDKNAKIAAKQKEIDNLKQQLSDMEDQLRKSGGDMGWAR